MNITEYKEYQATLLEEAKAKETEEGKVVKEEVLNIEALKESREVLKEAYCKFKSDVKDLLLSEAINRLVSDSISEASDEAKIDTEYRIANYVIENGGCDIILSNARIYSNTYVLERLENLIDKYSSRIYEAVDKTDAETFKVNPDDKDNFLDELDKEGDIESIKQAIVLRVTNAEEEFINSNHADKINIDSIVKDTNDRINSTLSDDTTPKDVSEAAVSDFTLDCKKAINSIRDRRTTTVFEQYVLCISEAVLSDPEILKDYQTENSKLDMDKIVEGSKCQYAILETLNTINLENVNSDYIKDLFK